MKTFEERYTAWIDGQLEGAALSAFELELARRAAEGEAEADRAEAARLRGLLQTYFQAPPLTNPDFFNHQLRERIEMERLATSRSREAHLSSAPGLFAWGFLRLGGLGALSLFAVAAIYYGMMPPHGGAPSDPAYASHASTTSTGLADNASHVPIVGTPSPAAPGASTQAADVDGTIQYVQLAVTPSPIDLSPDTKATVPDQPTNSTTVTPLHYNKPNVNVLWLNGLEYLPSVSETDAGPAATAAPTEAKPVPAPSAPTSP